MEERKRAIEWRGKRQQHNEPKPESHQAAERNLAGLGWAQRLVWGEWCARVIRAADGRRQREGNQWPPPPGWMVALGPS